MAESEAAIVLYHVASALAFCHEVDLVHCDVKPENVMLVKEDGQVVGAKLIDFGLSHDLNGAISRTTSEGSFLYVAPETLSSFGAGKSADIWSLGVLMYAVLFADLPFEGETTEDVIQMVELVDISYLIQLKSDSMAISSSATDLLKQLLERNPQKRLTASEVLEHAWFKSNFQSSRDATIRLPCKSGETSTGRNTTHDQDGLKHSSGMSKIFMEILKDTESQGQMANSDEGIPESTFATESRSKKMAASKLAPLQAQEEEVVASSRAVLPAHIDYKSPTSVLDTCKSWDQ
eukprot:TRINITY_DN5786_c0_g2_i1.p1 TRINITY_DN5786_c0_g2~~TRINITY_DN5786_c0_g2_i1.p1  ORF type:complete len:332 (+),score=49.50 TRINITY_DN5786_c0_g2_i1:124-996(+)